MEDKEFEFSDDELRQIIMFVRLNKPELLKSNSLDGRIEEFPKILQGYNVDGDDIGDLLGCVEMINAERAYFGELESQYIGLVGMKEAEYNSTKGQMIFDKSKEMAVGKAENYVRGKDSEIKADYILHQELLKRVTNHRYDLKDRVDALTQKISHLKQMWDLTKFQNR